MFFLRIVLSLDSQYKWMAVAPVQPTIDAHRKDYDVVRGNEPASSEARPTAAVLGLQRSRRSSLDPRTPSTRQFCHSCARRFEWVL